MRLYFGRLCILAATCAAFAQSDRGMLTGMVSDPQGAVVPNSQVKARNAATGAEYATVTTATGNYSGADAGRIL